MYLKDRVGETSIAKNGLKMTIVAYRGCNDIDIKFEDDVIVSNKQYSCFKSGDIRHPSKKPKKVCVLSIDKYLGKKVKTADGLVAEVIAYRSSRDVDILFEDGTLYKNNSIYILKEGVNLRGYRSYIGEKKIMNCGQLAEIVDVRTMNDIDIKIEGTILKGVTYYRFKKGELNTLGISMNKSNVRVGEERVMNCGMNARIIEYISVQDITVKFDDDTIVSHKRYRDFLNGSIQNPKLPKKPPTKPKKSYVGKTAIMKCGLKATIIRSDGSKDIDVEFETGEVVYGKRYGNFIRGNISPENRINRLGEEIITNCGLKATIVEYNGSKDITVQFEDGYIVSGKTYREFFIGQVKHNSLKLVYNCVRNDSTLGSFDVLKVAYKLENPKSVHYICQCKKCGLKDILSPSEMLEHKCSN